MIKKLFMTTAAMTIWIAAISAQTKAVKQESFIDTQARMLEVTAKSYIRPLVGNLVIDKGTKSMKFSKDYPVKDVLVGMQGNPDNLRSRAIYDATDQWGCDAIVAATFKIELIQDKDVYRVEMKGLPANFDPNSWHPITDEDQKWLEKEKGTIDAKDMTDQGTVIATVKR